MEPWHQISMDRYCMYIRLNIIMIYIAIQRSDKCPQLFKIRSPANIYDVSGTPK